MRKTHCWLATSVYQRLPQVLIAQTLHKTYNHQQWTIPLRYMPPSVLRVPSQEVALTELQRISRCKDFVQAARTFSPSKRLRSKKLTCVTSALVYDSVRRFQRMGWRLPERASEVFVIAVVANDLRCSRSLPHCPACVNGAGPFARKLHRPSYSQSTRHCNFATREPCHRSSI
jgi:hypothetical protein